MEHDEYYNGLDWDELAHDDCCRLIFMIEADWYCESTQEEYVRRARHKGNCDPMLTKITNGRRSDFGGTYESIIKNSDFEKYFHVTKSQDKKKKDTHIHPHISEIKRYVESKKTGTNYLSPEEGRQGSKTSQVYSWTLIQVSGSVARQTSKVRGPPNESISISDRLGVVVTRPNQKKRSIEIPLYNCQK